jgi:hypothetical protein
MAFLTIPFLRLTSGKFNRKKYLVTRGIVENKKTAFVAEGCCLAMRAFTPSPGGV